MESMDGDAGSIPSKHHERIHGEDGDLERFPRDRPILYFTVNTSHSFVSIDCRSPVDHWDPMRGRETGRHAGLGRTRYMLSPEEAPPDSVWVHGRPCCSLTSRCRQHRAFWQLHIRSCLHANVNIYLESRSASLLLIRPRDGWMSLPACDYRFGQQSSADFRFTGMFERRRCTRLFHITTTSA